MSKPRDLSLTRRSVLHMMAGGLAGAATTERLLAAKPEPNAKPTDFQIACMTLPYSQFPLQRALDGIISAGYRYVAWGTSHRETPGGKRTA